MKEAVDYVKKYYDHVDNNQFDELFDLFSDDILYMRCDCKIKGKDNFIKFYSQERGIKGKHTLDDIFSDGDKVAVRGVFNGVDKHNKKIVLKFADVFYLDDFNKIKERYTYLATDYSSTK